MNMNDIGRIFYLMALAAAKKGNLTEAYGLALRAAQLLKNPEDAFTLVRICLYEMCDADEAGLLAVKSCIEHGKWKKALRTAETLAHQSTRLLNIRGLLLACAGRYADAAKLFSESCEKDCGGHEARLYLIECARRTKTFGLGKWVFSI